MNRLIILIAIATFATSTTAAQAETYKVECERGAQVTFAPQFNTITGLFTGKVKVHEVRCLDRETGKSFRLKIGETVVGVNSPEHAGRVARELKSFKSENPGVGS